MPRRSSRPGGISGTSSSSSTIISLSTTPRRGPRAGLKPPRLIGGSKPSKRWTSSLNQIRNNGGSYEKNGIIPDPRDYVSGGRAPLPERAQGQDACADDVGRAEPGRGDP